MNIWDSSSGILGVGATNAVAKPRENASNLKEECLSGKLIT
jgi:hypothetical protein